ncbi:MAG: sugar phosphate isomerase/epimerase [Oscillospiraceae bacterium]|nr:sugar phosphate isomerase/epimerase [Oscillospiraceae bacterium]
MRKVKIGAPGFILLNDMGKDMRGTLKKISEIGFDGIEITGFFGHSAEEIKNACAENNLEPFGCFVNLATLVGEKPPEVAGNWSEFANAFDIPGANNVDDAMKYIKDIGCKYIGLLVPKESPIEETVTRIGKASSLASKYGMAIQYHNHDYEYTNMNNGEYRMDYLLSNVPDEVLFEPDLGWMSIGGYKPEKAMEKYAKRIEVVHLKDYYRENENYDITVEYKFRPTGYGVMDWARILPFCEKLIKPKWYVTDHDSAYEGDKFNELELSLNYVRNMIKL